MAAEVEEESSGGTRKEENRDRGGEEGGITPVRRAMYALLDLVVTRPLRRWERLMPLLS